MKVCGMMKRRGMELGPALESGSRRRAEAALWRAAKAGGLPHSKSWRGLTRASKSRQRRGVRRPSAAFGIVAFLSLLFTSPTALRGAELTRESVLAETLKPYAGPSERGVDTTTLSNKVMCGYQGWFNTEGDG